MFIVFEGIDGSGKSSAIDRLRFELVRMGKKVMVTAEPTNGKIGKIVAEADGFIPETEALLFTADRAHHTRQIKGWLSDGYWVICDRYCGSTLAYQSVAGIDIAWLKKINSRVVIKPDVTILLDVDPEISLERVSTRGEKSRFEKLDYLSRVRQAYLGLGEEFGYVRIDANRDRDSVAEDVLAAVLERSG